MWIAIASFGVFLCFALAPLYGVTLRGKNCPPKSTIVIVERDAFCASKRESCIKVRWRSIGSNPGKALNDGTERNQHRARPCAIDGFRRKAGIQRDGQVGKG
jgi:hypothetical protein